MKFAVNWATVRLSLVLINPANCRLFSSTPIPQILRRISRQSVRKHETISSHEWNVCFKWCSWIIAFIARNWQELRRERKKWYYSIYDNLRNRKPMKRLKRIVIIAPACTEWKFSQQRRWAASTFVNERISLQTTQDAMPNVRSSTRHASIKTGSHIWKKSKLYPHVHIRISFIISKKFSPPTYMFFSVVKWIKKFATKITWTWI